VNETDIKEYDNVPDADYIYSCSQLNFIKLVVIGKLVTHVGEVAITKEICENGEHVIRFTLDIMDNSQLLKDIYTLTNMDEFYNIDTLYRGVRTILCNTNSTYKEIDKFITRIMDIRLCLCCKKDVWMNSSSGYCRKCNNIKKCFIHWKNIVDEAKLDNFDDEPEYDLICRWAS
jgi:hypothetical protein